MGSMKLTQLTISMIALVIVLNCTLLIGCSKNSPSISADGSRLILSESSTWFIVSQQKDYTLFNNSYPSLWPQWLTLPANCYCSGNGNITQKPVTSTYVGYQNGYRTKISVNAIVLASRKSVINQIIACTNHSNMDFEMKQEEIHTTFVNFKTDDDPPEPWILIRVGDVDWRSPTACILTITLMFKNGTVSP